MKILKYIQPYIVEWIGQGGRRPFSEVYTETEKPETVTPVKINPLRIALSYRLMRLKADFEVIGRYRIVVKHGNRVRLGREQPYRVLLMLIR